MDLAPIVLFTYNRPWHTRQTIEALKKNELASESELFIFSDGPKDENAVTKVNEVRDYIKTIDGFKKINIIEREKNWGLANNIIDGVTKIVNEYGKIIVLEDDLVTSPYFLTFMNEALEYYKDERKVMNISGYNFTVNKENLPDNFFLKPTSGWGWATWNRAWKFYKKDADYYIKIFTKDMIKDFNLNGAYNYFDQIIQNKKGTINTWAIFWYASVYLQEGLSLHPRDSYIKNIGHDGTGVHCGKSDVFNVEITTKLNLNFPLVIEESVVARKALEDYFNSIKIPFWKRLVNKFYRLIDKGFHKVSMKNVR